MATNPLIPQFVSFLARSGSFREQYLIGDAADGRGEKWGSFPARSLRYDIFWAHYSGNVYRNVHRVASKYKQTYGLYEYTRSIFSPAYRLGEFYAGHLMGGSLDPDAGNGDEIPSALPIATESPKADAMRLAIAELWRVSNWQANKETFTRFGAVLGDVFLVIDDDPGRQSVRLRVVHPRLVTDVTEDAYGNVKGYEIQYDRLDPRYEYNALNPTYATYVERAEKVGESVVFRTFISDGAGLAPWDWRDYPDERAPRIGPEWTEDYGFVPMVKVQHRDMGLGWGFAEMYPSLSRFHEVDDLASKLDDQIRKIVENPRMLSGTSAPGTTAAGGAPADNALVIPGLSSEDDDGCNESARADMTVVFNPNDNADVKSMLGDMDIQAVSDHILAILKEIERNHPELQADMATASGDASGRALRVARERVEAMVVQRRAGYDDGLIRAQMMAISIGGMKQYPYYEAFDAGSYERGELDHSIGDRPVFAVDEADRLELATAFGNALALLVKGGMPFASALSRLGCTESEVEDILAEKARDEAKAAQQRKQAQAALFAGGDAGAGAAGDASGANGAAGANGQKNDITPHARGLTGNMSDLAAQDGGSGVPIGLDGRVFGS